MKPVLLDTPLEEKVVPAAIARVAFGMAADSGRYGIALSLRANLLTTALAVKGALDKIPNDAPPDRESDFLFVVGVEDARLLHEALTKMLSYIDTGKLPEE